MKAVKEAPKSPRRPPGSFLIRPACAAVLVCLLLRYLVEVKVTVSWRKGLWQAAAAPGARHFSNTCYKANDGICDEGRLGTGTSSSSSSSSTHWQRQLKQGSHQQQQQQQQQQLPEHVVAVECDLGTDSNDCGPWHGPQAHAGWSEPELPIAFLRSHNISVRARLVNARSAAPLAGMVFAYVDPVLDVDVSRHMETAGVVEVGISQVFYQVLRGRCSGDGSSQGLVVDVGANFGFHTCLAAKLGCSVVAWEPVPQFRALLSYNLAVNQLTHLVTVREAVVADNPGGTQVVHVPNRGIWGTAGIDGANIDHGIANEGELQKIEAPVESLNEVLGGQHIDLMKVDVEGFEPAVLSTATQLLSAGAIDNLILEYTPGVLEKVARWSEMWRPPSMLVNLTRGGFELLWLPDSFTRGWTESRSIAEPLPTLRRITPDNLAYDMWDAHAHRTGLLDMDETPFCQAMVELGLTNLGIPERLHPKSFHASFSHNTNVWATRSTQLLQQHPEILGRPVGIIPLNIPTRSSWFPPRGVSDGLGAVDCNDMASEMAQRLRQQPPPSEAEVKTMMAVLIGRRCRCTHQLPCRQHERVVEGCTRAGQTPYRDDVLKLSTSEDM